MSRFTVVLNEVLDRMKTNSGVTREQFARGIDIPMSTFHSYANGRVPDPDAVGKIADGFVDEKDATSLILAHQFDQTPAAWRQRLASLAPAIPGGPIQLADCDFIPANFRRDLELIIGEATHNEQLIEFVHGLVELLGLDAPEKVCPPDVENFRIQPVPAGTVHTRKPSGPSMPEPEIARVAEEAPAPKPAKAGPRQVATTRAGVAKTVRDYRKK
jgi:hypothetical protein